MATVSEREQLLQNAYDGAVVTDTGSDLEIDFGDGNVLTIAGVNSLDPGFDIA